MLCNLVTSYHKWPINQIYLTLNSSWTQLPRTLEKAVKLYILAPRRHAHIFKYAYFYAQISSCIIFLLTICLLTVSSEMIQFLCLWGKHWVRPACKCAHLGIHELLCAGTWCAMPGSIHPISPAGWAVKMTQRSITKAHMVGPPYSKEECEV